MRKRERWVVLGFLVVLASLLGTLCYAQAPIKWKGQNAYAAPPDVGPFKGSVAGSGNGPVVFAKWLNRETKGQFQLELAQPGAIVPVAQMFNAVSKGVLDFAGLYYGGFHTGIMPETDIEIGLPFAWEQPEEAWDAYFNRGLIDEFKKIYAEHNIYFIPIICNTRYSFGTRFPIPNPDAIRGKKIRATGIYGELVRKLGGSPVVIPAGEMYMALKLGTIDGAIFGLENVEIYKLKEVWTHYVFSPNLNTIVGSFLINMESFKKLPEGMRRLIDDNTKYILQEITMNNYIWDLYWATKASREYPFNLVHWSAEDIAKVRKIGFGLWDTVAAKNPRCAKLVEIVKIQMRDLGKLHN